MACHSSSSPSLSLVALMALATIVVLTLGGLFGEGLDVEFAGHGC